MKIIPSTEALLQMETAVAASKGLEVSGVGEVRRQDGNFHVDRVWLLDVGNPGYTEISSEALARVITQPDVDPSKIKCWWHRHPPGNGVPGPHNWSGTDNSTIRNEPLGSSPELVKWSISIVRTPKGWVGRVDHYVKDITQHLEVVQPWTPKDFEMIDALKSDFDSRMTAKKPKRTRRKTYHTGPVRRKSWSQKALDVLDDLGLPTWVGDGSGKKPSYLKVAEELGFNEGEWYELQDLLTTEMPNEVAEAYGLSLMDLVEMNLITWSEMESEEVRLEYELDSSERIHALPMQDFWRN